MKLMKSFSMALAATTLLCGSVFAQSVTVVDFGGFTGGGNPYTPFTGMVDSTDPAAIPLLTENADTTQADPLRTDPSVALNGGATLSWTNVSAWNNPPPAGASGVDPGDNFFLNRFDDPLDTFFTVATANSGDLVTIDFIGGVGRTGEITIGGATTIVPGTAGGNNIVWTNVTTNAIGSVTGELTPEIDAAGEEGNLGAIRVTITPAIVPEPSSMVLFGLGACTVFLRRRRS